jgi:hypothetical protein
VFQRLTQRNSKNKQITVESLGNFMASNGFNYHPRSLKLVIRLFDAEFKDSLGYQDFLKLALSKEDQDLRHVAAMRSNKDLLDG